MNEQLERAKAHHDRLVDQLIAKTRQRNELQNEISTLNRQLDVAYREWRKLQPVSVPYESDEPKSSDKYYQPY